jgi:DNA-binding transcriptional regulator YiaG
MNEVDLYNIHTKIDNSSQHAKDTKDYFLSVMIKHFRNDHKMSIREVAKTCNIKMKDVQKYLR